MSHWLKTKSYTRCYSGDMDYGHILHMAATDYILISLSVYLSSFSFYSICLHLHFVCVCYSFVSLITATLTATITLNS